MHLPPVTARVRSHDVNRAYAQLLSLIRSHYTTRRTRRIAHCNWLLTVIACACAPALEHPMSLACAYATSITHHCSRLTISAIITRSTTTARGSLSVVTAAPDHP